MRGTATEPRLERRFRLRSPVNLGVTLGPLWQGPGDPAMRFEAGAVLRATRTPAGPAGVRLRTDGLDVLAEAWGPGAGHALERLPDLLGEADDPSQLRPRHRLVADLVRRHPGLRLTRGASVIEILTCAVLAQKVSGLEARRAYRALVLRFGEPAPGPLSLLVPPDPQVLAAQPYHAFHTLGIERRRADTLRAAASVARQLGATADLPVDDARRRLLAVRGIGGWTAAETMRVCRGDPDEISLGDYNLPNLVAWALAGEPRAGDDRMVHLLEPYRGQRARVVRLLEISGLRPPRFGPRLAPRSIAAI